MRCEAGSHSRDDLPRHGVVGVDVDAQVTNRCNWNTSLLLMRTGSTGMRFSRRWDEHQSFSVFVGLVTTDLRSSTMTHRLHRLISAREDRLPRMVDRINIYMCVVSERVWVELMTFDQLQQVSSLE